MTYICPHIYKQISPIFNCVTLRVSCSLRSLAMAQSLTFPPKPLFLKNGRNVIKKREYIYILWYHSTYEEPSLHTVDYAISK